MKPTLLILAAGMGSRYGGLKQLIGPTPISVSYNMGWQRRSGGWVFDSLSGHGYLMGCLIGKDIHSGVLKKRCSTCMKHNRLANTILIHKYNVNHYDSSGSMESKLALSMVTDICRDSNGAANIGKLVTDDLKHNTQRNEDKIK